MSLAKTNFKNLLRNVPNILDTEVRQVIEHSLDIKPENFAELETLKTPKIGKQQDLISFLQRFGKHMI